MQDIQDERMPVYTVIADKQGIIIDYTPSSMIADTFGIALEDKDMGNLSLEDYLDSWDFLTELKPEIIRAYNGMIQNTEKDYLNQLTGSKSKQISAVEYHGDFELDEGLFHSHISIRSLATGNTIVSIRDETHLTLLKRKYEEFNQLVMERVADLDHDLKNKLIIAGGFSKRLQRKLDSDSELGEMVGIVANTIDDLMDQSQRYLQLREKGELLVIKKKLNLSKDIIRPVLSELSAKITENYIEIDQSGSVEKDIVTDPVYMKSVYFNLIDNAIKYGGKGAKIKLWLDEKDGQLIHNVHNTGSGIALEDLTRLYSRYDRLGKKDENGTGIGLSKVKTQVEALGGEMLPVDSYLDPSSSKDSYTTFRFSHPYN